MKKILKDLGVLTLGAALLMCSGCAAIDSIPADWKAAGIGAAVKWVAGFFE